MNATDIEMRIYRRTDSENSKHTNNQTDNIGIDLMPAARDHLTSYPVSRVSHDRTINEVPVCLQFISRHHQSVSALVKRFNITTPLQRVQ